MASYEGEERRRFFRIDDQLGVTWRRLTEEESLGVVVRAENPMDDQSTLSQCNKSIELILPQVTASEPMIGELLGVLDRKLNLVLERLAENPDREEDFSHPIQTVNISACGMAMMLEEPLELGDGVYLELLLLPERFIVSTHGRIVGSSPKDDQYHTRIDFKGMHNEDQEIMIQHLVKRQSAQIKAAKDDVFDERGNGL